jgi:hypothetical protein
VEILELLQRIIKYTWSIDMNVEMRKIKTVYMVMNCPNTLDVMHEQDFDHCRVCGYNKGMTTDGEVICSCEDI